jgi:hypothetical protein
LLRLSTFWEENLTQVFPTINEMTLAIVMNVIFI